MSQKPTPREDYNFRKLPQRVSLKPKLPLKPKIKRGSVKTTKQQAERNMEEHGANALPQAAPAAPEEMQQAAHQLLERCNRLLHPCSMSNFESSQYSLYCTSVYLWYIYCNFYISVTCKYNTLLLLLL